MRCTLSCEITAWGTLTQSFLIMISDPPFLYLPKAAEAEAHSTKKTIYELKKFPKVNEKRSADKNFWLIKER